LKDLSKSTKDEFHLFDENDIIDDRATINFLFCSFKDSIVSGPSFLANVPGSDTKPTFICNNQPEN